MMKTILSTKLSASTAVLLCVFCTSASANPLRDAASQYKDAVKHFEIAIYERHFDHYTKRMVQRLEDAAIELRAAAHHPNHIDRLTHAWDEVQHTQPRVESIAFRNYQGNDPGLEQCWERVRCAYRDLAKEIECICGHSRRSARPAWSYDPRVTTPPAPFPAQPVEPYTHPFDPNPSNSPFGTSDPRVRPQLPHHHSPRLDPRVKDLRLNVPPVPSPTQPRLQLETPGFPTGLRPEYRPEPASPQQARALILSALLRRILD